jgi:hypothetical protein
MIRTTGKPTAREIRKKYGWAIEIIRKRFTDGIQRLCEPRFLAERFREFHAREDPIYAHLVGGMRDEGLARAFVSYWMVGQTLATQSRFWLEAAIAEIVLHQAQSLGRPATHVYTHSMLRRGYLQKNTLVADIGEYEREHLTDRRPWRARIQESALRLIDEMVGVQERERVDTRDPLRPRAWQQLKGGMTAEQDENHLARVAAEIKGPPAAEVVLHCSLLVVEPDRRDGRTHAHAVRLVNPKTIASHPARKQERVNLLRLYALLVQEKILRESSSIHVCVAELIPRTVRFATSDPYPDYFSLLTHWPSERLWKFIDVPFEVLQEGLIDASRELRGQLKRSLRQLLPRRSPATLAAPPVSAEGMLFDQ